MSIYKGNKKIAGLYRGEDITHATEEHAGIIEIANQEETNAGTDDMKAVTPKKIKDAGYVKNTDYATNEIGGVIKVSDTYGLGVSNGNLYTKYAAYETYLTRNANYTISKQTLENVITGKGLVSSTDYATSSKAGVIKPGYSSNVNANGQLFAITSDYENYTKLSDSAFISKGTLNNVIAKEIGDIDTLLTALNSGEGV